MGDKRKKGITPELLSYLYPIQSVEVFEGGAMRVNRAARFCPKDIPRGDRKKITHLSRSSLSKLAFLVSITSRKFKSLLTLTYGIQYPLGGKQTREDRNRFLTSFKREFGLMSYIWFLEFQERKAPHLHIFLSLPAPTLTERRAAAICWTDAQQLENVTYSRLKDRKLFHVKQSVFKFHKNKPEVWEGIKHKEGAKRYALKYALKAHQKEVPPCYGDVGRFWGCSRDLSNEKGLTIDVTEKELQTLFYEIGHRSEGWEIIPKHLY